MSVLKAVQAATCEMTSVSTHGEATSVRLSPVLKAL